MGAESVLMSTITKRLAKETLGMVKDDELAELFGIARQAVNQWQDDEPIPVRRQWELWALYPRKFSKPATLAA